MNEVHVYRTKHFNPNWLIFYDLDLLESKECKFFSL